MAVAPFQHIIIPVS